MPPWLDWLDYFGADAIGRVVGLWLRFCLTCAKRLFCLLRSLVTGLSGGNVIDRRRRHAEPTRMTQPGSALSKTIKIVVSTSLTILVWVTVTSKPIWTAAGRQGDRILAGILLLVNAGWVISLIWILFSRPGKKSIAAGAHRSVANCSTTSVSSNSRHLA
jgi:hypothetical protein